MNPPGFAGYCYPKLLRRLLQLRYWPEGDEGASLRYRVTRVRHSPAKVDALEKAAFLLIISTILQRATTPLEDILIQWAGYYLMHGESPLASSGDQGLPLKKYWHMYTALHGRATRAFGPGHVAHQLGDSRSRIPVAGGPPQLSPNEALLHMACYQRPGNYLDGNCGAICLMSVFSTEDEALDYLNIELPKICATVIT